MRHPLARFRFFSLALLLILLGSSLPAFAGVKSAQNAVLGDSNLYRYANNNPVNYIDPEGLNPVLGAAVRILGPQAAAEVINPTVRQTGGLPEGVLGETGFTEDGQLKILINRNTDTNTKINALANECVHYGHLRARGDVKIPGDERMRAEMASEMVDAVVGTVVRPGDRNLREYQSAVRNDMSKGDMKSIFLRSLNAHEDDLLQAVVPRNARITLPPDAR